MLSCHDARQPERLPDDEWAATLRRLRSEFDEMPCTRLTPRQARAFFGLGDDAASQALLDRLEGEGFLALTAEGVYVRCTERP